MADEQRTSRVEELQEQVNRRVREAVDGLQRELRERLRRAGDEIVGELDKRFGDEPPALPESFLSSDELAPFAEEAAASARSAALAEAASSLAAALGAVDRAGSQSAVLDALVGESGRFAGRTALFLAKEDGLELWGADGWEQDLDGTRIDFADEGPWSAARLGRGTVDLSSSYCGELCSRVEAPLPDDAVLVPLVLRDRLAAVLYADQAGDGEMSVEALQSLTYVAALALETLPFRRRSSTPTLRRADDEGAGEGDGEGLGVWSATAAAAPSDDSVDEPGAGDAQAAYAAGPDEPTVDLGEPLVASEAKTGAEEEMDAFALADEDDLGDGEDDAADDDFSYDLDDAPYGEDEAEDEASADEDEAEAGTGAEADDADATAWASEPESSGFEVPSFDDDAADDDGGADTARDERDETADLSPATAAATGVETVYAPVPPPPAPEVAEPDVEEPEPDEPEVAEPEVATPAAEPEVEEPRVEDAAVAEPEATAAPAAASGGSQVAPPADLEGPGRAFGASAPRSEDESRHEEARRLARLLVSEIRLYNEDEVDEGRRNHDIYRRLKEDIDRSRQMYEERVDPAVRDSTDYFYQELVRNLGGGDESSLGL